MGQNFFISQTPADIAGGPGLLAHLRLQQCPAEFDPASFRDFPGRIWKFTVAWTTTCELVRPGRAISVQPFQNFGSEIRPGRRLWRVGFLSCRGWPAEEPWAWLSARFRVDVGEHKKRR